MKFEKFERKLIDLSADINRLVLTDVKAKSGYEKVLKQLYEDEVLSYLESVNETIKHINKTPVYCGIVTQMSDGYYVGDHKLDKYETIEFSTYSVLDDEKEGYDEERVIDSDFLKSIDIDVNTYDKYRPIDRYINIINDIDTEEYFVNARIGKVGTDYSLITDNNYLPDIKLDGMLVLIRR